ncbi:DUF3037 domain-containing protein [Bradyrhizobium sp. AS23.2]|uniref:DUF3037 domain-containing protein n=1 Tax=Bradyrhizobium sp. AS23.2 TaxID=1680155 RepID=UPI00093C4A95|nr:DUF3037 domain-containing protein [Bradyrhizobium sp. AS23.2]OKO80409.1 hypothetical protein AC630_15740 [Bradyrhizobium sp. AS23.2]
MFERQGYYALLQYSDAPERLEYINIGVALFLPSKKEVLVRFSHGLRRVERMFGKQPHGYLNLLKTDFAGRLSALKGVDHRELSKFANSRVNKIRIAGIQSILVEREPQVEIDELFDQLVGEDEVGSRRKKVAAELKDKFEVAGVDLLLEKPEPVQLPQGVTVEAPYAYQNGFYNLIDAVRLDGNGADALARASERAVVGQWLRQYSIKLGHPKQLVVVGDFASTDNRFRSAVDQMMREHFVKLYDFEMLDMLIEDIRKNSHPH